MRRRWRRRVATWLAFCVLIAQSVALAYACQREIAPVNQAVVPCAVHLSATDGGDANALPDANVCVVHCQGGALSDVGVPDVPHSGAVVAWLLPVALAARKPPAPVSELEARSAAPPPLARYTRLLI